MDNARLVKISKYLSKHLRHQPARIGLKLQVGGWVDVEDLLAACRAHHFPISRAELDEVVAKNDKQRFAFDENRTRLRASQGHSVTVDLELPPAVPPAVLYHGTSHNRVDAILQNGLKRMQRQHVHLSTDTETAIKVGARHGKPVVLQVDTAAMHAAGFLFYVSANGVWLTDEVAPQYLQPL